MQMRIVVNVLRGEILESRHSCEAAVCDAEGRCHAGTADPQLSTTFRSAAKPFQLLPLVERGAAERWSLTDEELAVMTSSHNGSAAHRALVAGILARLGLEPERLVCGYHDPLDPEALEEARIHPELRSPIYNNCSGKHAGMLALARAEGWPVEGYEQPEHPVQQAIRRVMGELSGLSPGDLATATDDCGVPVFAAPLAVMAKMYARLAGATDQGDPRERALHRIRTAMTAHPQAVGGPQRFSTRIMEATRGRVVAKGGAEGLECLGVPARGLGLALKCLDGSHRACAPAMMAVLEQLGLLGDAEAETLADLRVPRTRSRAGRDVGRLEATVEVASPSA